MIHLNILDSRDAWLKARESRLGGSDIASVIGKNPYTTNVQLYREKAGIVTPEDVSDDTAVAYGRNAEPLLRELFKLDHPELNICYAENNMFTADEYPFAHASLDGWWDDGTEIGGILEIKTATIQNARQRSEWDNRIPDHYYCQVLWYMMVTGARLAWVQALLRWERRDGSVSEQIRQYRIERYPRVDADIKILEQEGRKFWTALQRREQPPLILPSI